MGTSVVLLAIFTLWICSCQAKVNYKVKCSPDMMEVEVVMPDVTSEVYLLGLKDYPDTTCQPQVDGNKATFRLNLTDVFECSLLKIVNKLTEQTVYVQRIVVEDADLPKQIIQAKCTSTAQRRRRRNVLPAGFQEPDFRELEIQEINETAPVPLLGVGVRQGGQLVTGELNVNPGTPLQMEIFLDKGSAPVYGLLVSYMQVTDTKVQEETIIFNGCSVDPYLFENFNTVDGDFLSAKFRAFKFPESTYVQFKGTVNVCLDKCRGVECSNGQTGYGRRRREVLAIPNGNKVFEVTMSTFIKVAYTDDKLLQKGKLGNSVIQSQPEQVNATSLHSDAMDQHLKLEKEEVREELRYTIIEANDNLASLHTASLFVVMTTLCLVFIQ